ncbi:MAG TPA: BMP family protein [Solirubrobacterales bacterium]|nr:BMP family protein [Solirubrobacterales bacterium]
MRARSWRLPLVALAALVFALALASCGGDDDGDGNGNGDGAAEETNGSAEPVSTAIVLPCPISDAWCKQGHDAAVALEEEGEIELEITTNAPQDTAGVTRVLSQYAQGGTELLLAHSTWQDAAFATADQFPDANIATYSFEPHEQVAILEEPIHEAAYLAGMIAGGITETDVVGGLAGQDVPLCRAELEAFAEGAGRTNKNVEFVDNYLGEWNDAALGKQVTESLIDQDADVVIACGGGPASGMIQAIQENDISGFGYVGDQSAEAPEHLVGSVMYNLEPYFGAVVEDVRNDEFRPAGTYSFGLADGGTDLLLNPDYNVTEIPDDVMQEMEQVREEIQNGEFEVPYVPEA